QQNVPFPINEVVWDYQLMGGSEDELNVVLVAMKSELIESITDCISALNLTLEIVDVAPMALYNAVRYNYGDFDGCTLVMDLGARSTNLIFLEENRFFSRNLPVGTGNAITQQIMKEFELPFEAAEELKLTHASVAFGGAYEDYSDKVLSRVSKTVRNAMTRLHVEVERSMNFYRTQQGGTLPKRILLAGGTSVIQRMDEFFKEKLKVDVYYINPFRNIVIGDKVADEDVLQNAQIMGETVGVALRYVMPCPLEVNMLPAKVIAEKNFERKKPFFIIGGLGLIFVAICWILYFFRMGQLVDERIDIIKPEVQRLAAVEQQLSRVENDKKLLIDDAETLTALIATKTAWAEVINEIHSRMPDGMWLMTFKPQQGMLQDRAYVEAYTGIEVRGMIFNDKATERTIRDFRDSLKSSEFFKEDANETKITLSPLPGPNDYVREFTIEVGLENPIVKPK
ncbi:MAG: pilus assembly protein PilM, partial [Lentisphaerae bacterium]|nr:pilus assembly protein PilM [Lentisphaerota bacterium]